MGDETALTRFDEVNQLRSEIGDAFRQFGAALASSCWKFEVENEEIVARVAIPEVRGLQPVVLPFTYLDRDVLIRVVNGMNNTDSQANPT